MRRRRRERSDLGAFAHGAAAVDCERRVELASDPKLLLLDEPAAGPSVGDRGIIRELISGLPDDITCC